MKIFCIVGYSHTRKTSTAVAVIKELLRRGYTVGVVKEYKGLPVINGIADTAKLVNLIEERTDIWQHDQA